MSILKDLDPQYAKIHAPRKNLPWAILSGALSLFALFVWTISLPFGPSQPLKPLAKVERNALPNTPSPEPSGLPNSAIAATQAAKTGPYEEPKAAIIRNRQLPEKTTLQDTSEALAALGKPTLRQGPAETLPSLSAIAATPSTSSPSTLANQQKNNAHSKDRSPANRDKNGAKPVPNHKKTELSGAPSVTKKTTERDVEIITAIMQ